MPTFAGRRDLWLAARSNGRRTVASSSMESSTARALFGGDAFHDRTTPSAGGQRVLSLGYGSVDQGSHLGVGEGFRRWQANKTILAAAALQDFVRIGDGGTPVKRQADTFGVSD